MESLGEKGGVLYVNDSKSTTVESLRVALESVERPLVLLAGGVFKGGDLASLIPLLCKRTRAVALFGASRDKFEAAWKNSLPVSWDATLEVAVQRARGIARSGDVILLSPATSSFDLYANYKARGDDFKRIVKNISGELDG
jgi:UDP-N-acetylmuramoylalanine--D-glutamate ligase